MFNGCLLDADEDAGELGLNFVIPDHGEQRDGSECDRNCQLVALVNIRKERNEGDENRCRIPESGEHD